MLNELQVSTHSIKTYIDYRFENSLIFYNVNLNFNTKNNQYMLLKAFDKYRSYF